MSTVFQEDNRVLSAVMEGGDPSEPLAIQDYMRLLYPSSSEADATAQTNTEMKLEDDMNAGACVEIVKLEDDMNAGPCVEIVVDNAGDSYSADPNPGSSFTPSTAEAIETVVAADCEQLSGDVFYLCVCHNDVDMALSQQITIKEAGEVKEKLKSILLARSLKPHGVSDELMKKLKTKLLEKKVDAATVENTEEHVSDELMKKLKTKLLEKQVDAATVENTEEHVIATENVDNAMTVREEVDTMTEHLKMPSSDLTLDDKCVRLLEISSENHFHPGPAAEIVKDTIANTEMMLQPNKDAVLLKGNRSVLEVPDAINDKVNDHVSGGDPSDPLAIQDYMRLLYPSSSETDATAQTNTTEMKLEDDMNAGACVEIVKLEDDMNAGPYVEIVVDNAGDSYSADPNPGSSFTPSTAEVIETVVAADCEQLSGDVFYPVSHNDVDMALSQQITIKEAGEVKEKLKSILLARPLKPHGVSDELMKKLKTKLLEKQVDAATVENTEEHVSDELMKKLKTKLLEKQVDAATVENTEEHVIATENVDNAMTVRDKFKQAEDRMTQHLKMPSSDLTLDDNCVRLPEISSGNHVHPGPAAEIVKDTIANTEMMLQPNKDAVLLKGNRSVQEVPDAINDKDNDHNSCKDAQNEISDTVPKNTNTSVRRSRKSKCPGKWVQQANKQSHSGNDLETEDAETSESFDDKIDKTSKKISDIDDSPANPKKYRKARKTLPNTFGNGQYIKGTRRSFRKRKLRKYMIVNDKKSDVDDMDWEGSSDGDIQPEKVKTASRGPGRVAVRKYNTRGSLSTTRKDSKTESVTEASTNGKTKLKGKAYSLLCEKCGAQFASKEEAVKHKRRHKRTKHIGVPWGKYLCGDSCICDVCGNVYKNTSALSSHIRFMHSDEKCKCSVEGCEKVFTCYQSLRVHTLRVHTDRKKFVCNICDQKFKMNDSLKCHIARVHNWDPDDPDNLYRCPVCRKALKSKFVLDNHVKIHKNQRDYMCPFENCGKTFICKYYAKRHVRLHRGVKPYQCEECGEKFARRDYLAHHQWKHTGTKPFHCEKCGRGFGQKGNLDVHIRSVHGSVWDKLTCTCTDCGKTFSNKSNMLAHKKRKHKESELEVKIEKAIDAVETNSNKRTDTGTGMVDTQTQTAITDVAN